MSLNVKWKHYTLENQQVFGFSDGMKNQGEPRTYSITSNESTLGSGALWRKNQEPKDL